MTVTPAPTGTQRYANIKIAIAGTGYVGMSNAIAGITIQPETMQGWVNQCKQITSPRIIPDIELVAIEGKTIATVSIAEYPIKPVACKGRYFKRVGNANHQMFDDRIEFFNPGTLLDGLTIEQIKTGNYKSHLRNKQIASVFRELDLIEKYGSGVRRVIDTFVAYGLPEPEFEATQGGMAVTVFKANTSAKEIGKDGGVNSPETLLQLIRKQPGLKTADLVNLSKKPQRTVERWLKQLKAQGLVEFRGAPKTGGYHATPGNAPAQQGKTKE